MRNILKPNTSREKAWKVMRTMGTYTISEVCTIAEASYENITHYHKCLVKAGYARQVGTRKQEGRAGMDKVYRLAKNTGPKPPVQKSLRFMYDPNTKTYWAADPELIAEIEAETLRQAQGDKRECECAGKIRFTVIPGSVLDMIGKQGGR